MSRFNLSGLLVGLLTWAVVLFVGYAACSVLLGCASLRATPEAKARRSIASKLDYCLRAETVGWSAKARGSCWCEAEARCLLANLPDECGALELFMQCIEDKRTQLSGCVPPDAAKRSCQESVRRPAVTQL